MSLSSLLWKLRSFSCKSLKDLKYLMIWLTVALPTPGKHFRLSPNMVSMVNCPLFEFRLLNYSNDPRLTNSYLSCTKQQTTVWLLNSQELVVRNAIRFDCVLKTLSRRWCLRNCRAALRLDSSGLQNNLPEVFDIRRNLEKQNACLGQFRPTTVLEFLSVGIEQIESGYLSFFSTGFGWNRRREPK